MEPISRPELARPGEPDPETKRALKVLWTIGGAMVVALSVTYAIPQLAEYRPWIKGDPVPFAAFFSQKPLEAAAQAGISDELLAEAAAAAAEDPSGDDGESDGPPMGDAPPMEDEPLPSDGPPGDEPAEEPGDEPAGEPSDPPTPGKPEPGEPSAPVPPEPAPVPEPGEPAPKPEPASAPKPLPVGEAVNVSPDALAAEYKGITGELELTGNLKPFFAALDQTARREAGAVTRITHYGASEIGADGITSVVRRKLQAYFGSAGKGWVNVAPGWQWYKHKDVVYKTRGWSSRTVTSNDLNVKWGKARYGFGGVAGLGWGGGAEASYKVWADRLELFYLGYPKGGDVAVSVNGGPEEIFSTKADAETDLTKVFRGTPGAENTFVVKSKGGGTAHVYGVTLETDGPGVVYDCIQLIGTRASRYLNFNEEHLKRQTELRKPDLQVILYGGNELVDRDMALGPYEEKYEKVIRRMRAGALEGACIVMAPQDHGEVERGRVRTVPLLLKLIPIQRRIAEKAGCAFYDTLAAMGGEGTMGRWYNSKPRLAWGDYMHLTPAGDRVIGAMLYKALMKAYADYRAAQP